MLIIVINIESKNFTNILSFESNENSLTRKEFRLFNEEIKVRVNIGSFI